MKRKTIIISILIIALILIIVGFTLAFFTDSINTEGTIRTGSVAIDPINLQVQVNQTGTMGRQVSSIDPGDSNLITWHVKNKGKSEIYTRNTLKIYWNENIEYTNNNEIYLYPANMTKEQITADFIGSKESAIIGENKIIKTKNNEEKLGIEYVFYGDTLDGIDATGVSVERNYNTSKYSKATDDTSTVEDNIAFKMFFNPRMSYLFQEKTLSIEVVTEAMQYNLNGDPVWEVVYTENI